MAQFTIDSPAIGDVVLEEQTADRRGARTAHVAQRTLSGQIITSTGGRYDMTGHAVHRNGSDNNDYGWRLTEDTPENRERIERLELERLFRNTLWRRLPTDKLRQIRAMLIEHQNDPVH